MKVAVCIPHLPTVAAEFAFSLSNMVARTARTTVNFNGVELLPEIKLFMRSSPVLPQLRNMLVKDARSWEADYLLWADSDHKFPDFALLRLLSHNQRVVGTNYPKRIWPSSPTATAIDGTPLMPSDGKARGQMLEEVSSMGFGLCLMDASIFDQLSQPYFDFEMVGDGSSIVGEDVHFFRLLQHAQIPAYVDHALSWDIGHVHSRILTNADLHPEGSKPISIRF